MTFAVGSLIRARGREWVVLPDSTGDTLIVRPLGGADPEQTGIFVPLEKVEPAAFAPPNPEAVGDHRSCRLLRDAIRLGFRSSAGPFRSFGGIAVTPRPYQLVPLLMALKLDPVRLLIADDVGIGKTVEAGLIARELLDRGEITRFAVLCPPHLAEQWQHELKTKFHIEAKLVLASTVRKLERDCAAGESIFERYPHVIISTDYIKSSNRRDDFIRTCPEFVIVDEAHTCAFGQGGPVRQGKQGAGKHHRYELLRDLANDPRVPRHIVLVTATPHSGKEEAFRSLLVLLDKEFENLPLDLSGDKNRRHRERLAAHVVQRRRPDIAHYVNVDTPFPKREEKDDATYKLSPEYKKLFENVLEYVRELTRVGNGNSYRQRVRWWSALALLRALASSPMAARATLLTRAGVSDGEDLAAIEERGRLTVMDQDDESETIDVNPAADVESLADDENKNRAQLLKFAKAAEELAGKKDQKLQVILPEIKRLLSDGFNPIVFCRFVATADYLATQLKSSLPKSAAIFTVNGTMSPDEREAVLQEVAKTDGLSKVLVCTDCLSEGVNLQDHFDSVIHYDLAWNPTRHEQREGRVDRFGQKKPTVRVITYYGLDNQIDGIILDTLIRKQKSIRNSLGIYVPVPVDTNQVLESIFEGLLLREEGGSATQWLPGFEEQLKAERKKLHDVWQVAADRESKSQGLFRQLGIKADEVAAELEAISSSLGSTNDIKSFTIDAITQLGGKVSSTKKAGTEVFSFDLSECPRALTDLPGVKQKFDASVTFPPPEDTAHLGRTAPFVSSLSQYLLEEALDGGPSGIAKRCGCIRTKDVDVRTTLLLLRLRFQLIHQQSNQSRLLLAEDCKLVAYTCSIDKPQWLSPEATQKLLACLPSKNVLPDQAREQVRRALTELPSLTPYLNEKAENHGGELLAAHTRVREAATLRSDRKVKTTVEVKLPVDIMGVYVFLPEPKV